METILNKPKIDYALYPKEVLAAIDNHNQKINIGIPKENNFQEKRIALTPNSVAALVNLGCKVSIENEAGLEANFGNDEYIDAGAKICYSKEEVYEANTIIKAAPIDATELSLLHRKQTIISPILLPSLNKNTIKNMMEKGITALAYEYIKSEQNIFPFIRSMSEIAGNLAIITAANYLSTAHGKGILLGGIAGQPPTRIVILGAGKVAESVARYALALGASVHIFDDNIDRLARLQNDLGIKVYTSILDPINLAKNLSRADVVIGALRPIHGKTPRIVSEDMVRNMKKNAVIIDVSIDSGGCFETSKVCNHHEPHYIVHNVIHYAVPNIAANVPRTASFALSNILAPILKDAMQYGGIEHQLKFNAGLRHGTYLYKGALCKDFIAQKFDLKYTNLELILSADF
jgi:alanine dehydrogenase